MLQDRGPFRRAALKSYISQMSRPNPKGIFDGFVAEILDQQGFVWEEDPRSIYDPQQLYTALERYATEWQQFEELDDALTFGFRKAFKIFAKPKDEKPLRPYEDEEVINEALKLEKSSGLPLMTTKEKSLVYSFDRESQIRSGMKAPNPCVAYKRTQRGNKTRLVWGYPLEMTIMEARFARPLIERFRQMATPMAFCMSKMELGAKLARYFEEQPGTTVCLDYSKYDTSISRTMIYQAFRILRTWFSDEDTKELGWDTVVKYFVFTPIVMPNGHLYTGKNHGVPSGSYFTQMIDSIVNVALVYALKYACGLKFEDRSLYVLGDDVIVQVRTKVELKKWATWLAKHGITLHDDAKTVVGEVHFLGAFWTKGKPDAPIDELVNKACFPEAFRVYQDSPSVGAENVLRSYASSYKSAWRFLPLVRPDMRLIDLPTQDDYLAKYMSGSDRYLFEENRMAYRKSHSMIRPALCIRYLL
uniref:RNA-dependent RNA polymerase n=1 Tax=Whatley partiti-like virus TaxID=2716668 RepID=A0A6G7PS12_9VIRU|nr:RNA-dependent RNA polymerase [Whatley partiti-like virus]